VAAMYSNEDGVSAAGACCACMLPSGGDGVIKRNDTSASANIRDYDNTMQELEDILALLRSPPNTFSSSFLPRARCRSGFLCHVYRISQRISQ